jgi:hypothetical protein
MGFFFTYQFYEGAKGSRDERLSSEGAKARKREGAKARRCESSKVRRRESRDERLSSESAKFFTLCSFGDFVVLKNSSRDAVALLLPLGAFQIVAARLIVAVIAGSNPKASQMC